ncbi:ParA family protein [Staphylococcus capitis]|uniref:ParA family protein n=1 Tax=Staphylococcus capitis TaxID=29388 RepID=UPI000D1A8EEB|nr:ParA family protein [Staphylococcus capitis]PTG35948.1 ParA family protein [Staphylococcus capitis]PTH08538.1 ParA family protein [Staphylococcus capitis]RIM45561.1 ParA family protein [Staphylococcus capitis]
MSVITVGNFKGGVGKTTVATILSYIASEKYEKKVLLIDFDPQGNATQIMKRTYPDFAEEKLSFIDMLKNGNIERSIVRLTTRLSLLPADSSLANLSDIISRTDILKKRYILKNVIAKIKVNYDFDYIFIDVPPTINSDFTNNAVYASDYILMVFQTQQSAYESSLSFVNFLRDRKKESDLPFELVGAVPVLIKKSGRVDKQILEMSKSAFAEALFDNQIYQRERVKKFAAEGIRDKDMHDKKVIYMFNKVYEELVKRIEIIESE